MREPIRSKSSSVSLTPRRPAIASKCTTAFVEPPIAARARIAFSNDALVITSLGLRSLITISTIRRPVLWAACSNLLSAAGIPATPGSVIPSASAKIPIVDAVPIVLQ